MHFQVRPKDTQIIMLCICVISNFIIKHRMGRGMRSNCWKAICCWQHIIVAEPMHESRCVLMTAGTTQTRYSHHKPFDIWLFSFTFSSALMISKCSVVKTLARGWAGDSLFLSVETIFFHFTFKKKKVSDLAWLAQSLLSAFICCFEKGASHLYEEKVSFYIWEAN